MALTKRLRFEILRRDGHTCRYCGASAPDVQLTVDHVTPAALGGSAMIGFCDQFETAWNAWTTIDGHTVPLPGDWETSIESLVPGIKDPFRYFCGSAWNVTKDIQGIAKNLLRVDELAAGIAANLGVS